MRHLLARAVLINESTKFPPLFRPIDAWTSVARQDSASVMTAAERLASGGGKKDEICTSVDSDTRKWRVFRICLSRDRERERFSDDDVG